MIIIKTDSKLDEEMYLGFSNLIIGGMDFGKRIKVTHPNITNENYKEYILSFYETNKEELRQNVIELQQSIDSTKDAFFAATKALFDEDFSNNEYTGALSIFDCNPRFVDKKLFQIFYKRDLQGKLGVAYHEILHFAFFDYCLKHCADIVQGRSVNDGAYWELSELLNVIILNQPAFQAILKQKEQLFYPSLSNILPDIEKLWSNYGKEIPKFVEKSLKVLGTKK